MSLTNHWQNKVAIVTGGSSGIGKATAVALADQGAKVFITGRNIDRLKEVADAEANLQFLQIDSADHDSGKRIVDATLKAWGQIDLIVNNAGAGRPLPIGAYDSQVIADMAATNIAAPSSLIQAALDALANSKGAVVNVSSAVTRGAAPMLAHYAATKAALEHLTKSWAIELAPEGIRVNTIAPGPVKSGALTDMMGLPADMAAQVEAQEAAQVPLGRRGEPADIVPWILQLGHSSNAWMTGQVLTVDGGWSLRG